MIVLVRYVVVGLILIASVPVALGAINGASRGHAAALGELMGALLPWLLTAGYVVWRLRRNW